MSFMKEQRVYKLIFVNQKKKGKEKKTIYYKKLYIFILYIHTNNEIQTFYPDKNCIISTRNFISFDEKKIYIFVNNAQNNFLIRVMQDSVEEERRGEVIRKTISLFMLYIYIYVQCIFHQM